MRGAYSIDGAERLGLVHPHCTRYYSFELHGVAVKVVVIALLMVCYPRLLNCILPMSANNSSLAHTYSSTCYLHLIHCYLSM
jgi:hypothetical protein